MTEFALSPSRSRADVNPWLVAGIVIIPTFMEVLDTTIALVALRYIAGGLSATVDDGEWVITSYLAANAVILPISGWLSARLGRRNYFLLSIAVFTLASGLCGMATSLGQLIVFRVVQGLAGGGLQPSSQGVLLDAFPVEKQGIAMTLFGLAALLAPVVGPTLGGWITDSYSWRWVFYINVPVGLVAFAACYALLRDSEYLTKQRMELRKQPLRFDGLGLSLLVIVMVSWEVVLSKGQEWDWLGDPFWRVQTLAIFFVLGLIALIFWELRHPSPVVNFRPLRERNFAACCFIIFCAFAILYAASTSLPALLQSLFGYDALSAGLVMSPAGIGALVAMPFVGLALGRGADARWLIAAGLLIMAIGNYWMSQMNLDVSPGQVVWPRVMLVFGLSMCFAPANVAAYLYIPPSLRGAAVGLLSLLRNEGGSVGTLNAVWEVGETPGQGIWHFARSYVVSLAAVLALGFLLLVSLLVTAALAAFGKYAAPHLQEWLLHLVTILTSLGIISLLFAMMFKWLPDTLVDWYDVWLGALVTSVFFELGKSAIGFYIGKQGLESTYGAAASIIVVLIWVYYSSQIILMGAEITHAIAKHKGSIKAREQPGR